MQPRLGPWVLVFKQLNQLRLCDSNLDGIHLQIYLLNNSLKFYNCMLYFILETPKAGKMSDKKHCGSEDTFGITCILESCCPTGPGRKGSLL